MHLREGLRLQKVSGLQDVPERGEVVHDIGREQAANKPLLKTVFQVMMRFCLVHVKQQCCL